MVRAAEYLVRMSALTARRSLRAAGAALLTCTALALSACGDDDEGRVEQDTASTTTAPSTTPTETAPVTTETEAKTQTAAEPEAGSGTGGAAPGEEQEGGAGDEIGASSQALVTGRGGKLAPRVIRVPPFIAIRVELRSADGRTYELGARGKTLRADGDIASASTTFAGLRPGRELVLTGPSGRVVVEASAEPGP